MLKRLSTSLVSAIAVALVVAPIAFAQQNYQPGTGTPSTPGNTGVTGQPGAGTPGTSGSPGTTEQPMQRQPMGSSATGTTMGGMGMQDAIHATVAEVNQTQKTVRLRMQNGAMVELKVPDQLLADLNQGDSVQVTIHKEGQSGTTGTSSGTMSPSRSESGNTGSTGPGTARPPRSTQ
jgi:hypothetical protein